MEIYVREEFYPIIEVETLNSDSSDYDNSIAKHIKETVKYDQDFLESGILGRVIVTFTITKEGKVTNEKIIRGVYDRLDKDVLIAITERLADEELSLPIGPAISMEEVKQVVDLINKF